MIICPVHSQPYRLEPRTQKQIIEVLHDQDFPDLAGRIIIRIDPQDPTIARYALSSIFEFFEDLYTAVETKSELEKRFRHYAPEWWRINRYMLFTGYARFANPPADYHDHYTKCLKTWGLVSERLGIHGLVFNYQAVTCFNDRCALAYTCTCSGARFTCAECDSAFYCDDRWIGHLGTWPAIVRCAIHAYD
ncbi:unnamed protein product [Rhizoctonia solani]|uniref:Uncharacterized protein n=1 Tax=Rhizoctonia solani TaxID=456999 RepID=A0A8H3GDL0_9AGAM|nr:unnamed protein product [Rhizoctonia solani]